MDKDEFAAAAHVSTWRWVSGGATAVFARVAKTPALLVVLVASCTVSLQGCAIEAHTTAAWETKPSYLSSYTYVEPGTSRSGMNSCNLLNPVTNMYKFTPCSGNGVCTVWNNTANVMPKLYFCQCSMYWADPECRTRRKSQMKAYFLSLVGGFLGLDQFYLGDPSTGVAKLLTLGGFGFWWIYDVVRLGSGPVYAQNFRLAADLPHRLFIVVTAVTFAILGYLFFGVYTSHKIAQRKKAAMLRKEEAEFFAARSGTALRLPPEEAGDRDDEPEKINYITLVPTGLGDYGSTRESTTRDHNLSLPGGPYRNAFYFASTCGMRAWQAPPPPVPQWPVPVGGAAGWSPEHDGGAWNENGTAWLPFEAARLADHVQRKVSADEDGGHLDSVERGLFEEQSEVSDNRLVKELEAAYMQQETQQDAWAEATWADAEGLPEDHRAAAAARGRVGRQPET